MQQNYTSPVDTEIQVIQKLGVELPVVNCHITITRRVFFCGFLDGAVYSPHTISFDEKNSPSPADCKQMALTRSFTLDGITHNLTNNDESNIVYISHGQVDENGWCRGAQFSRHGKSYLRSVESTEVRIFPISQHASFSIGKGFTQAGNMVLETPHKPFL